MYQDIKVKREKARQEHIKQTKEKALEEQRILQQRKLEEEKTRTDQSARENKERAELGTLENGERTNGLNNGNIPSNTDEVATDTKDSTSSVIGNDWSEVSPQDAAGYMASKTGVSASTWEGVIFRESSNNPMVTNSIGCFGYLQIHPVHGNVSGMTPQQYLDTAVQIYQSQGVSAWEAW